jgi:hypothetical protein
MMIGDAILRPGLLRRTDALVRATRHAVQLLFGGAVLLIVAGTIEAFFSPSGAPDWSKFAVGVLSGVLLYAYLLGSRPTIQGELYTFEDVIAPPADQPVEQPVTAALAP